MQMLVACKEGDEIKVKLFDILYDRLVLKMIHEIPTGIKGS